MRLDVHMSVKQYRTGFADTVADLLELGNFRCLAGQWQVRRRLALLGNTRRGMVLHQVTFELAPLDLVALRISQRQGRR